MVETRFFLVELHFRFQKRLNPRKIFNEYRYFTGVSESKVKLYFLDT